MNIAPVSFVTRLFDLLSPRQCAGCKRRLSIGEWVACDRCMLHISFTPFSFAPRNNMMARMFWGLVEVERAAALFFYEANSEPAMLIHAIKYHGQRDLAENLGEMLARELEKDDFFSGIDVIVPVPLSADRQRTRGYNQSECLGKGISNIMHIPVAKNVLARKMFKGSQTRLNPVERRRNVEQAFWLVDGAAVEGKHVLLVDDVMTTGSTLLACATALSAVPGVRISMATLGFTK